ncbi:MAG TPA: diacylglycerol kinase family protein [Pilimelia sp.]|nr:diacylglycerol kinase family protein [Pilimelia sp.]
MSSTAQRSIRRALVVANPAAGTYSAAVLRAVLDRCRDAAVAAEVLHTTGRGHATAHVEARLAGPRPPHLVVAVGGDGTVREVVKGLVAAARGAPAPADAGAALFPVPAGTGNSTYLALWGHRPWADALHAVLRGDGARLRRLDLARLDSAPPEPARRDPGQAEPTRGGHRGEPVVLGACSGIVAEALVVARSVAETGRARYLTAFTRAARDGKPYPGRVTVDGAVVYEGPTMLANVGGGRHRGGSYLLLPRSILDDGQLDVCVLSDSVAGADIPDLIRHGAHLEHPGVHYARGRRIGVTRLDGAPLAFEHDGELVTGAGTGFTLEVLAGALPVWAPVEPPHG